jgi:hypothetical protein
VRPHGNEQGRFSTDSIQHGFRESAAFPSKHERIAGAVLKIAVAVAPRGFHGKSPRAGEPFEASVEARMNFDGRKIVIIKAGSLQTLVIQAKPQRFDQVQRRAGVRAQANGVTGIGRNLGLEQYNMKHLGRCGY